MSNESQGSGNGRVELESVTCWPLILGAGGFVLAGACALMGFLLWGALQTRITPQHATMAAASPAHVRPAEPSPEEAQPVAFRPERQVILKRTVVNEYNPAGRPRASKATPPPTTATKEPKRAAVAPAKPAWKTPSRVVEKASLSAEALRQSLQASSREIDLEAVAGAGKKLFDDTLAVMERRARTYEKDRLPLTRVIREFVTRRDDLRGLPLIAEEACQSSKEAVRCLAGVSAAPRVPLGTARTRATTSLPTHYSDPLAGWLASQRDRHTCEPLYVAPLVQVCEVESDNARLELLTTLARTKGAAATRALAGRAVFDLSPEVREMALADLKGRSADEARSVFLAALAHPWANAADHAARALIELDDRKAIAELQKLLDGPDPCRPFNDGTKWQVRELVRANHLRNCLLCHPPSADRSDSVTGPIPTPGKLLPEAYYSRRTSDPAVRADVVFLRQDFSALHAVEKAKPWPAEQRFDYLVRVRDLPAGEADALLAKSKGLSPQRQAVKVTLAELKRRQAP